MGGLSQVFILVCLIVGTCYSYPTFRNRIPNGYNVPHPCKNTKWEGVGHENEGGAGKRNTFGTDFKENGLVWNATICNKDSDGDGMTNGEELGDPDCEWTPGSNPKYTSDLSHPGVCQPMESSKCDYGKETTFVKCEEEAPCKVLSEPDTVNFTVTYPIETVPPKETTYMCLTFEFPRDKEYHIVAHDPIITNLDVMHHIVVYGCEGVDEAPGPLMRPSECGGEMRTCTAIFALWGAGAGGSCYAEKMGFLVGSSKGYKYAIMQLHWNNPELRSDYVDSSGMVFHLTPKLRPFNAGVLSIGQNSLLIPPGIESYSIPGVCPGECTKKLMPGPIYISTINNHMHLLGRSQHTEIYHSGVKTPLAVDNVYKYDTPVTHVHTTPVQMFPGDELKTTCTFNSTSRTQTTRFGQATSDEMCYAFLTYYPKENLTTSRCVETRDASFCDEMTMNTVRVCLQSLNDASNPETGAILASVQNKCSPIECLDECLEYVRELKKQLCFSGDVGLLLREAALGQTISATRRRQITEWISRLDSCDRVIEKEDDDDTSPGATYRSSSILMTSLVLIVSWFRLY